MENAAEKQAARIEGDYNHVEQNQSVRIQVDLVGAVVDQFIVQGGMHIYIQAGPPRQPE